MESHGRRRCKQFAILCRRASASEGLSSGQSPSSFFARTGYNKSVMSDAKTPDLDPERRSPSYPTNCPSCQQQAAKPKSVATVAGQPDVVRLHMLCGHCAHSWTEDAVREPVV